MREAQIEVAWEGPPQCRSCAIRHLVLFADLQKDDFRQIHQPVDEVSFEVGEPLYRTAEAGHHVLTVRGGLAKLVQYLPNGDWRIVRLLRQGDLAGMEALLGQPYQHDALALEPVTACRIPVSVVEALSRHTPRVHRQLMERWQRAVSAADAWLTELSTGPAKARVARLLIRLTDCYGRDVLHLPSREDMGAMLGITTETASRITAEFKREGYLRTYEGGRAAVDAAALQAIAHG